MDIRSTKNLAALNFFFIGLLPWIPQLRSQAQQSTPTPQAPLVAIFSPQSGQALQGIVPISGQTAIQGFASAELSFAYHQDERDTWFLIQEMEEPVINGDLAHWDTTTLTDGLYTLRLVIHREGGETLVVLVSGLRVRNYTPVETDTPAPATAVPGVTTAPTSSPTPTATLAPPGRVALPPNPAEISPTQITGSLRKGALAALAVFILLGLYSSFRLVIHWRRERS